MLMHFLEQVWERSYIFEANWGCSITLSYLGADLLVFEPFGVAGALRVVLELVGWFWSHLVSLEPIGWFSCKLQLFSCLFNAVLELIEWCLSHLILLKLWVELIGCSLRDLLLLELLIRSYRLEILLKCNY